MGVHNTEHVDYIKRSHNYFVFYFIADGQRSSHDQGLQMKSKGHVFVVDDDQDIRIHLGDVLKQLGYSVSDFGSALEFLKTANHISPAVLLLDMRMPSMNGLDLQNNLTDMGWQLPVIYMSGESHNQEIIDGMKGGAIDFLWKPFAHTQLVQAIDKGMSLDAHNSQENQRLQKVALLHQSLSLREKHIFALMLLGHGNKAIAAKTGVMADTVKKQRAQVLAKMQVDSLADLLAFCQDFVPENFPQ